WPLPSLPLPSFSVSEISRLPISRRTSPRPRNSRLKSATRKCPFEAPLQITCAEGAAQGGRRPTAHALAFVRGARQDQRHRLKPAAAPMPLAAEIDTSSPKHLRDKYAIVGVGETTYTRGSGMTTRALGTWAVRNAMQDAGLKASDVDGMLSYQSGDSTFSTFIAGDLGIRPSFYMDVFVGGSSTEALIGLAMGVIEAGMCKVVAIFRAMNGYSQVRIGGTGARSAVPISGEMLHNRAYGWQSAGQLFSFTFMRHMHDYATTPAQV